MKKALLVFFSILINFQFSEKIFAQNFTGTELLGRPTDHSVTVNVVADAALTAYFKYSTVPGTYTSQTTQFTAAANQPVEAAMDGLAANTRYYYRMVYSTDGGTTWTEREEHSFMTQRAKGSAFTFTITSDSHLGQYGGQTVDELALYQQTLQNIEQDNPDFHIGLGDDSAMDPSPLGTGMTEAEAQAAHLFQRPYLGEICHSIPFFLVLGNHENEEGWNFDDVFTAPDQSLAVVGLKYRKMYYPNPIPDGFYSGNADPLSEPIGGDTYHEDYYAWEWGDALFVVIDPYHYSMTWPAEGNTYGGEGTDGETQGDRWDWTLGIQQYLWLKSTLENSDAKFKFVFSHHVTGGNSPYGRGGVIAAPFFEWGGKNADGTWGFDTERPAVEGWDVPIHQLMAENGVSIYFHGHDHIYAYEELDDIVYLECPKPDDAGYAWEPYGYGHTENHYSGAVEIQNSGYIRVTVTPDLVTTDYVRSYLPGDGNNGTIAHTVTIEAPYTGPTHNLTLEVDPANSGTTNPSAGTHAYPENRVITITANAANGNTFDHWTGDVADVNSSSTTVTMDSDKTVTAHFREPAQGELVCMGSIGTATSKTSGTSLVITTSAAVAAGDAIIIAYGSDPYQDLAVSVSDDAGNTYTQVALDICYQHVRTYLLAANSANALPSGSTITITANNAVTARAAVTSVFRGLAATGPLDQILVNPSGTTNTASGTQPTVGPTGTTSQAYELLISAIGTEGPVEDNAGTWDYDFVTGPRAGTAGSTATENITVCLGYRIVNATGTYSAQKSGITSAFWGAILAAFKAGSVPGTDKLGDINDDGAINSTDALVILSCDVSISISQFCPCNCGDVNSDGLVNSTDALIILSYDAGITVSFPIGQEGCPETVIPCPGCNP